MIIQLMYFLASFVANGSDLDNAPDHDGAREPGLVVTPVTTDAEIAMADCIVMNTDGIYHLKYGAAAAAYARKLMKLCSDGVDVWQVECMSKGYLRHICTKREILWIERELLTEQIRK